MPKRFFRLAVAVVLAAPAQNSLYAQASTPRQRLKEALASLQSSDDSTVRDKIIRLVRQLDPPPAVPDEVAKLTGRAVYAYKNATTPSDYEESIEAYRKALLLAPWVAKNYYNLGVVQEKAGKPTDAIQSFNWYLFAAPDASDATAVRERIGGLEFAATKVAEERERETAAANLERDKLETFEAFKRAVQGVRYVQAFCAAPDVAPRGMSRGCTWSQFQGSNWYRNLGGPLVPLELFWVFHDGFATLECSNCTPIRLRAGGSGFENLVLDWQGVEPLPDRWFPLTLVNWKPDFSDFTIGYVSSKSQILENPDKPYYYTEFIAKK